MPRLLPGCLRCRGIEGDTCAFCEGGRLRRRRVRHFFAVGRDLVVIDDVPAYVCSQCGERYFVQQTVRDMRRLSREHSLLRKRVSFPRMDFARGRESQ